MGQINLRQINRRTVFLPFLTAAAATVFSITPADCSVLQKTEGPDKATIINVSKPVNKKTIYFRTISFTSGLTQYEGNKEVNGIESTITQSSDNVSLSQTYSLGNPADSTISESVSVFTVSSVTSLSPNDTTINSSCSSPTILEISVLPIADSDINHSPDLPNIIQWHLLAPEESAIASGVDPPVLSGAIPILCDSASHAISVSESNLTEVYDLPVDDASNVVSSSNSTIGTPGLYHIIKIFKPLWQYEPWFGYHPKCIGTSVEGATESITTDSAFNALSSDSTSLIEIVDLVLDESSIASGVDPPSLAEGSSLSCDSGLIEIDSDEPINVQSMVVSVDDATTAQSASLVSILEIQNLGSPDDTLHAIGSDACPLTGIFDLITDDATHSQSVSALVVIGIISLSPNDNEIIQSTNEPGLVSTIGASPDDTSQAQSVSETLLLETANLSADDSSIAQSVSTVITDAAKRYWVNGTGSWTDATNHWALSSGGTPGAGNTPNENHDVYIDANSGFGGGGTITLDTSGATARNLTCSSGHSYTITSTDTPPDLSIYASASLESGITFTNVHFYFLGITLGNTLTCNGASLDALYIQCGAGSVWLQDALTVRNELSVMGGIFNANDQNISAGNVSNSGAVLATITMGDGTWTITGSGVTAWYVDGAGTTLNADLSTIKFTDATATGKTFWGGDKTYNNLWFSGAGTGGFYVYCDNTFNDFKCDTPPHNLWFDDSSSTTVTTFTVSGTAGNFITINSIAETDQHNLICNNYGFDIICDYLNISHSDAQGAVSWYAGINSLDTIDNDGWIFYHIVDTLDNSVSQSASEPTVTSAETNYFIPILRPVTKRNPIFIPSPRCLGHVAETPFSNLVSLNATNATSVSEPTLVVTSDLSPDASSINQSSSESELSPYFLASNDSDIDQSTDSPALTSGYIAFIPRILRPATEMTTWFPTAPLSGTGASPEDLSMQPSDIDQSVSEVSLSGTHELYADASSIASTVSAFSIVSITSISPNDNAIAQSASDSSVTEILTSSGDESEIDQSTDEPSLVEIFSLSPDESTISISSSDSAIGEGGTVTPDESAIDESSSEPSLVETVRAVGDESSINQTSSEPDLTGTLDLVGINDSNISQSVSESELTGTLDLAGINDSSIDQSSSEPSLSEGGTVTPDESSIDISDGGVSIVQTHPISPDESTIEQSASESDLSGAMALVVNEGAINQTVSEPDITGLHYISPDESTIEQASSLPSLGEGGTVSPDDCDHAISDGEVVIVQVYPVSPDESSIDQSTDEPTLDTIHVVSGDESSIEQTASQPLIEVAGDIYPDDSSIAISDSGAIFVQVISPNDCEHDQSVSEPELTVPPTGVRHFVTNKNASHFVTSSHRTYWRTRAKAIRIRA